MADMQDNDKEEKKDGIGLAGGAAAVATGAALGLGAQKLAIDSSIKSNWATPYADATKAFVSSEKEAFTHFLQAGKTEEDIITTARRMFNDIRHEAFHTVTHSDNPHIQATLNDSTVLGTARKAFNAKHPWDLSHEGVQYLIDLEQSAFNKFTPHAQAIAAATGEARTAEAGKLLDTIIAESQRFDKTIIASKTSEISWLKRINPFAEGLHLSATQKGLAVLAGTATLVIGAVATGKVVEWMFSNKDSTPQR